MAIKFVNCLPVKLYFPFGDALEVKGQYGMQHLYTVERDGERDKLYASRALHQKLQAAGMGPGSVFSISKMEGEGGRSYWEVESDGPNGKPQPVVTDPGPDLAPEPEPTVALADPAVPSGPPVPSGNGDPVAEHPSFVTLQRAMFTCLQASLAAWTATDRERQFKSEDVRAVGITLFLECARKGISLEPVAREDDLPF